MMISFQVKSTSYALSAGGRIPITHVRTAVAICTWRAATTGASPVHVENAAGLTIVSSVLFCSNQCFEKLVFRNFLASGKDSRFVFKSGMQVL